MCHMCTRVLVSQFYHARAGLKFSHENSSFLPAGGVIEHRQQSLLNFNNNNNWRNIKKTMGLSPLLKGDDGH